MSLCDTTRAALVDEAVPRTDAMNTHLASCPDCQAFARAHRAALQLQGTALTRARRRPLAEVQRRAGIVAGLLLAVFGGVGLWALEVTRPQPARVVEAPLPALDPREDAPQEIADALPDAPPAELLALAELDATVRSNLSRDPREDAAAVKAFGALPEWLAPRRTQPVRSLGRAASPIVYTSEDMP